MSSDQLIPLHQLDLADVLRVDARYARLTDAELMKLMPSAHDLDALRSALAQGELFYCTDTPALQLVFFDQGDDYLNPAASAAAGEPVINALKHRFSRLNPQEEAPYQIFETLTASGIRGRYWPPRTGPAIPVNYTPDPTPTNITPIRRIVNYWLDIRFYRLNAEGEREYLEGVPYSINTKYQSVDRYIFEQGFSSANGAVHRDHMPNDGFYTVYYGLPGTQEYIEEALVCPCMVNELEIITPTVTVDAYFDNSWRTPWPLEQVTIRMDKEQVAKVNIGSQPKDTTA